ncbi:TPA: phage holin family protein [Staphylococcus aureus]
MEQVKDFNVEVDDFISLIYSGNSVFIDLLLIMIFIDIITGVLKAFSEGKLWSHKAITGYIKKIAYLCVVLVANTLDIIFRLDGILVNSSVIFLIIAESTSIIENAAILGVPIPDVLKKRLGVIENQSEK